MSDDFLSLGIQAAQAGNYPLAQEYLSQAVRSMPNSAHAWYWLGLVLEDPQKKKYCLDRAASLGPTPADDSAAAGLAAPAAFAAPVPPAAEPVPEPAVSADLADQADPPGPPAPIDSPSAPAGPPPEKKPLSALAWAGIAGAGLLLLLVCVVTIFLYARNQAQIRNQQAALQAEALLPTKTPFVFPTRFPTETPRPIFTRTASPVPSLTPTFDPTQLYQHLGFQITAARMALDAENDAECLRSYDKLLSDLPAWHIGYYNRGVCKRMASADTHYLDEYEELLRGAIADQDTAIALDPYYSNAYVERAFDYDNLINTLANTAEDKVALNIAFENLKAGLDLGTTHKSAQLNRAILLVALGRCQEGLQEATRQLDVLVPGTYPEPQLYHTAALAHLCLGENSQALAANEKSLAIRDELVARRFQTAILIALGDSDQAFEVIDRSIQNKPDFHGYRFYLRALIYFDRGDIDLARQDLLTGSGYTWYHRGLYAYLMGRLALYDGDSDEGKAWLQYAAASMQPEEGLWLKKRIQSELTRLDVLVPTPTPGVEWDVTPIPPQRVTPTQTPERK